MIVNTDHWWWCTTAIDPAWVECISQQYSMHVFVFLCGVLPHYYRRQRSAWLYRIIHTGQMLYNVQFYNVHTERRLRDKRHSLVCVGFLPATTTQLQLLQFFIEHIHSIQTSIQFCLAVLLFMRRPMYERILYTSWVISCRKEHHAKLNRVKCVVCVECTQHMRSPS